MTQLIARLFGTLGIAAISLFSLEAGATCTEPSTNESVLGIVAEGETYFAQQKMDQLTDAFFTDVIIQVECMGEPITLETAASVHRLMAVSYLLHRDREKTLASLASARAAYPDFSYQRALNGTTGHPLEVLYNEASSFDSGDRHPLKCGAGQCLVDGGSEGIAWLYTNRPGILQLVEIPTGADEGVVTRTAFIEVGEALPDWANQEALPAPLEPVTRNGSGLLTRPGVYYGVAGALLAGSVTSAVISQRAHNAYNDPSTPNGDLAGLETQTNSWGTASAVLLGAATVPGGFGVTLTFTGRKKDAGMSPEPSPDLASNP